MTRLFRSLMLSSLVLLAACSGKSNDPLTSEQHQRIATQAAAYKGDIRYGSSLVALSPSATRGTGNQRASFNAADEFSGLPHSAGYEKVFYTCSACHSLAIVMQQRKTAPEWTSTLDWMIAKQGMPQPEPADRKMIEQFLAREFGNSPPAAKP